MATMTEEALEEFNESVKKVQKRDIQIENIETGKVITVSIPVIDKD